MCCHLIILGFIRRKRHFFCSFVTLIKLIWNWDLQGKQRKWDNERGALNLVSWVWRLKRTKQKKILYGTVITFAEKSHHLALCKRKKIIIIYPTIYFHSFGHIITLYSQKQWERSRNNLQQNPTGWSGDQTACKWANSLSKLCKPFYLDIKVSTPEMSTSSGTHAGETLFEVQQIWLKWKVWCSGHKHGQKAFSHSQS